MEQTQLPVHVAIIPDGNGRWAKERNLSRSEGHYEGAKRFREISKSALEMGIPYFTFWAASYNNLTKRSHSEVQALFSLLQHELETENTLSGLLEDKIKFRVVGDWFEVKHDTHLLDVIKHLERKTNNFSQYHLTLLFGYNGTAKELEIMRSALPLVDLMIRTASCEEGPNWTHNSCGLMTLLANDGRLYSPPTLWPDFTTDRFRKVIEEFSRVSRRHGA